MKQSNKQIEEIANLKQDYKQNIENLRSELKDELKNPDIFKFEISDLKDDFKNKRNFLKIELNQNIKKIKNPEKFELVEKQKEAEQKIVEAEMSYLTEVNGLKKQLKKAKRKSSKEEVAKLKTELKETTIDLKKTKKENIASIEKEQSVNKVRKFKNSMGVTGKELHRKSMPVLAKISNQKHLVAIRNAFSSLIPLIMIASFITVIRSIPLSTDPNSAHAYLFTYFPKILDDGLVIISSLTMGLMSVALAFAVGVNLGQSYGEGPVVSGIMGFIGFILWVGPQKLADGTDALPLADLGSKGLFIALVTSIIMFELYRLCKKYRITIRLPKSVPPAVGNSFIAIIPAVFYATIVLSIRYVAGWDLINEMTNILKPIGSFINDNFGAVLLILILNSLFWWFGIHGSAITGIITYPFWYPAIAQNQEWFQNGAIGDVPNTFVEPYYQWAIWIGGAGSTIGLAISSIIFSKSKQNKAMSKATIVPAVFNISEPMMFGFPVVLNVALFVPFILAPIGTAITSIILVKAFSINWVVLAPWSLPGPIGAFLASGNNWGAIVMCLTSILVATLIYMPFFKIFDNALLKEEQAQIAKAAEKEGMEVKDYLRKIALEERNAKLSKNKQANKQMK